MFRTISSPANDHPVSMRWVLLMLISCLALHFLIEDSLRLSAAASTNPAFSEQQRYEETTHQDDLAAPLHLPERIANGDAPAAFSLTVSFRRQASSPIFPPPKIA